jgi:hypothetical protein
MSICGGLGAEYRRASVNERQRARARESERASEARARARAREMSICQSFASLSCARALSLLYLLTFSHLLIVNKPTLMSCE